jgi:quinol monooxygenase YgiN
VGAPVEADAKDTVLRGPKMRGGDRDHREEREQRAEVLLWYFWIRRGEQYVIIVAGHLVVDPEQRDSYLAGCVSVVEQGRRAAGCLDFTITADLVDPGRIGVFERWESREAVEAFRGSGPSDEQSAAMLSASVAEYDVADVRPLT